MRSEWLLTQYRDSLTTYLGHPNMLMHIGLVENESLARVRFNLLEVLSPHWNLFAVLTRVLIPL